MITGSADWNLFMMPRDCLLQLAWDMLATCICLTPQLYIMPTKQPGWWSYPRWTLPNEGGGHGCRNRSEPMHGDLLWWEGLNLELTCMQRSPCYQFYLLQCRDAEVDAGVRRELVSFRR